MLRISIEDLFAFILMAILLLEIDFKNMSLISWIGLFVSIVWCVVFITRNIKVTIKEYKKGKL